MPGAKIQSQIAQREFNSSLYDSGFHSFECVLQGSAAPFDLGPVRIGLWTPNVDHR